MGTRLRMRALFGALVIAGCGAIDAGKPPEEGGGQSVPVIEPGAPAPGEGTPPPALPTIPADPNAAPLTVLGAWPSGEARYGVQVVDTFSRPVVALGTLEQTSPPPFTLSPSIPGRWRWMGSSAAEFVPDGRWPGSTHFIASVPAGLSAVDGGVLANEYSWTFSTMPISVEYGSPVSGYSQFVWAKPDQVFELGLTQKPVQTSLVESFSVEPADGKGAAIPLTLLSLESAYAACVREAQGRESGAEFCEYRRESEQFVVRMQPARPLALATAYQLVIKPTLQSAEGPRTYPVETRWGFRTYGDLTVSSVGCSRWGAGCPQGPLSFEFSNSVTRKALREALTIEPPVRLSWPTSEESEHGSTSVWLDGAFKPETTYSVRLAPTLVDTFGQALGRPFTGEFKTGAFAPHFSVRGDRALLERGLREALPVTHVNTAQLDVGVARLDATSVLPWLQNPWDDKRPITFSRSQLNPTTARNQWGRSPLDLAEAFKAPGDGRFALIELSQGTGKERHRERIVVQVTDLAVHHKLGPTRSEVFVWRLSTGAGAPGAAVELVGVDGRVLAQGVTDAQGVVALPGVAELPIYPMGQPQEEAYGREVENLAVRARLGDDVAASSGGDDNWSLSPWNLGADSAWEGRRPTSEGFVFVDRGIYRPGDPVYVKGFLRERALGRLSTPVGRSVSVELRNPQGEVIKTELRTLSAFGGFDARLEVPKAAPLGDYAVRAVDPNTQGEWMTMLRVAEYRAPEFQVDVRSPEAALFHGDLARGVVEGRYLFGSAMRGARVEWSRTAEPATFTLDTPDGFVFGRRSGWYEGWRGGNSVSSMPRNSASGVGELDAQGELVVESGAVNTSPDSPVTVTLEATVVDVNRQRVSGRSAFVAHPAAHYVGLLGPGGFGTAGVPFDVQVVAVDALKKTRLAGKAARVTLRRTDWHTVQKQTVGGAFETVSEEAEVVVGTCDVTTAAKPVSCAFKSDAPGYHTVVAESTDAAGRKTVTSDTVWVGGEGYASWLQDDDAKVEIVADRATYDVGDTATLLVQSPYPEAEAWITVEREGVLSHQRLRLRGTATPIKVKIDESMIPNVYVGVVLARGRVAAPGKSERGADPGRPSFRAGYRELRVVPDEKRLSVSLKPDAAEKPPGATVGVDVFVADRRGRGVQAEVAVWAVDEGVLRLTGYTPPDPLDSLFLRRGLSVKQGTNVSHLVPQLAYGEKGKDAGGDGGAGMGAEELRSKFVTTPIFIGDAVTGRDGRVRVEGKLPDNLTTFRLMAVAVNESDRGGRGESKVVVNQPLMARPALPRAARVGDKFAAGVVVHLRGKGAGEVDIDAKVVTGGLELLERGPRRVRLEADRAREIRFAFRAMAPGSARVRFSVKAREGGASDEVEIEVPVTRPNTPEVVAAYGVTQATATEALRPPATGTFVEGEGGLSLSLASSALAGLADDAKDLIDYPYGCLEQQSSRLVPLVALRALLDTHGKGWLGDRDPREVVSTAARAITAMQTGEGGFGYWPGASCAHYFGTAYATLALGEAQRAGYQIDTGVLDRARNYLVRRYASVSACEWSTARTGEERAVALAVLARQDAPQREWARQLFEQRADLALFGRALLAQALALSGTEADLTAARGVLDEVMQSAKLDAGTVYFAEVESDAYAATFSTNVRTTAMVLQAMMRVRPDHPLADKVARYLTSARQGGRYATTQEAAFALLALQDYAQIRENEAPAFDATVSLGAQALAQTRFEGKSLDARQQRFGLELLTGAAPIAPLTLTVQGKGSLYYGARLTYVPTALPTTPVDAGLVVQRWYTLEPEGARPAPDAAQVRSVREGALVRVHVRLAAPRQRHYVALEDPLPSGLEPVDTTLETSAQKGGAREPTAFGEGEANEGPPSSPWSRAWYSVFDRVELRDDRVVLFANHLPPGVHDFSYLARATTAGTFVLKPARAEAMYAPELWGRSDGGTFWVHPGEDLTAR